MALDSVGSINGFGMQDQPIKSFLAKSFKRLLYANGDSNIDECPIAIKRGIEMADLRRLPYHV